ncbi:hypothetical protein F5Y00DRAFT_262220 [Daldinia vernicosa]|uniref:uncharacterized protein n=1 Tax=Daldinia vernicosa TaxID=114800 RepID=UPI002007F66D|nr:uncharacterized protein F5Y00DRAFT_262220 [Daldinia vernicosa]KAI0848751.1 hypothetical protein F5Y00DRAFT_262220 [Daldinia vernicosa]
MSIDKNTRLTHKSLPKLIIPKGNRRVEPEEITASRVEDFLDYCIKFGKAPITRLPDIADIAFISLSGTLDSSSGDTRRWKKGKKPEKEPYSNEDQKDPDTIAFTACDYRSLDALQAELAEVKVLHEHALRKLLENKTDKKALLVCRTVRMKREEIDNEISEILRKRTIRRKFRQDYNNPPGLTNW